MTEEENVIDPQVLEDFLKEEMPTDEEMAADFAAGFTGSEAKKEVKQEQVIKQEIKQEVKKEAGPEEKPEEKPDPFSLITTKLDSLDANLNKRIRHIEGRFGDLNAKLQSLSKPEKKEPQKHDNSKLEYVRNEYEEMGLAEAVEEQVKNLESKLADQYGDLPKKVKEEVSEIREMLNDTLIEFRHKGWKDTIKTDEFASWFESQDQTVQELARSAKLSDAIELLDKFSVTTVKASDSSPAGKKPDPKKTRLEAAAAPETKGARIPPVVRTEEDDFREGFNS